MSIRTDLIIEYSTGRGKSGSRYAFVRPAEKCANRSRRFRVESLDAGIVAYFGELNFFMIEGMKFCAKNEAFALREFWRVCEKTMIGKVVKVERI